MSTTTSSNFEKNINEFYDKLSYYNRYNADIWITISVIVFVTVINIYFFTINNVKSYRADWEENKCNPLYIAMSGTIKEEETINNPDFAKDIMNECLDDMNNDIANKVRTPIQAMFDIFGSMFATGARIVAQITSFITYLFGLLFKIFAAFMQRLRLIITENNFIIIQIMDFMNSVTSIITNVYYSIMLLIDSIKLSFYMMGLSFFATVILPTIVTATSTVLLIPIYILIAAIWNATFFFSWMSIPFITLATVCTITFIALTAFTIYCTISIYQPMMKASRDILSKNVGSE